MTKASDFRIDPATENDLPLILGFIHELAEYERLYHDVRATEPGLRAALFGPDPFAEVVIARAGSEPAGFAVYFHNFSTFLGRPGLYLEDLFVRPRWRGRGLGRRIIGHLARLAVERGCGRMEWSALDWNEPAIRFYGKLGAERMDQWTTYRLGGDALRKLALGPGAEPEKG